MTHHPEEGILLALLDGELSLDEDRAIRAHLAACASCTGDVAALEDSRVRVSVALGGWDPAPRVAAARAALLTRLQEAEGTGRGRGAPPAHPAITPLSPRPERRRPAGAPRYPAWLRAAAGLLVGVVGVGASTLPGSPVRDWWESRGETEEAATAAVAGTVDLPPASSPSEVGVFVVPEQGQVRIDLAGLPGGALVRVEWMDAGVVGVHALDGARFETGPGRVHAVVERGGVRVELPRDLRGVTLWVNGERYLVEAGGRREILGPGALERGDTLVFVVDGPVDVPPLDPTR
jgi:anti-sigma factor RsiW